MNWKDDLQKDANNLANSPEEHNSILVFADKEGRSRSSLPHYVVLDGVRQQLRERMQDDFSAHRKGVISSYTDEPFALPTLEGQTNFPSYVNCEYACKDGVWYLLYQGAWYRCGSDEKEEMTMQEIPKRVVEMRKAWAANDAKRDAGLVEPEDVVKYRDISYGPCGTWNLLDLYVPDESRIEGKTAEGRWPVIVSIHGGGFFYGDKELYRFYCMHLAEFGFAVVNFNYRLAPESHFPAPLADTMAVMRWISANADQYGLDTSRVFMVGDSAGAQLVSQFACMLTNKEYGKLFRFETPEDICVRAISLSCGTYRLAGREKDSPRNPMMMDYFGDESLFDDPRTEVLENITGDYPPTYIFSAYNDPLIVECEPTAELLASRGIEVKCRIFGTPEAREVGHVFQVDMRLEEGEKANREQTDFFKAHMG